MKMITILTNIIMISSLMLTIQAKEECLMGAIDIVKNQPIHGVIEIKSMNDLAPYKNNGKPTVVKCYTSWCGPCKALKGPYEELAKEHGASINFLAADGDRATDVMYQLDVEGYPTFVFYDKNGSLISSRIGGMSKGVLIDLVEQLKNGTMQKQNMKQKKMNTENEKPVAAAAPIKQETKKQPRKEVETKKAAPARSMSRRQSAPKEITRRGPGGKKIRYVAVEDEE